MQVYLLVAAAVFSGFLFGLVYGLLDVEDTPLSRLHVMILREQTICYPIGALLGAAIGAVNHWLRESETVKFQRLQQEPFGDEAY